MEQDSETYNLDGAETSDTLARRGDDRNGQDDIEALADRATRFRESIDANLTAFQGQLSRLKAAIENQITKIDRGEIADADFGTILKRVDPLMLVSIQQETKIHEKLAERAGRAGQQAIDFSEAKSEIGRRLACLRRPGRDDSIR